MKLETKISIAAFAMSFASISYSFYYGITSKFYKINFNEVVIYFSERNKNFTAQVIASISYVNTGINNGRTVVSGHWFDLTVSEKGISECFSRDKANHSEDIFSFKDVRSIDYKILSSGGYEIEYGVPNGVFYVPSGQSYSKYLAFVPTNQSDFIYKDSFLCLASMDESIKLTYKANDERGREHCQTCVISPSVRLDDIIKFGSGRYTCEMVEKKCRL